MYPLFQHPLPSPSKDSLSWTIWNQVKCWYMPCPFELFFLILLDVFVEFLEWILCSLSLMPWRTILHALWSFVPALIASCSSYTNSRTWHSILKMLIACIFIPLISEEDYFSFNISRKFFITSMPFLLLIYMFLLRASLCSFSFISSKSRMLT